MPKASGYSDRVTCFYCCAAVSNWNSSETPLHRHMDEYVECAAVVIRAKCGTPAQIRAARRKTFFKGWPNKPGRSLPSSGKVSDAGFIFAPSLNAEDNVKCLDCGLEIHDWTDDMDPLEEHKRLQPDCPFLASNEDRGSVRSDARSGSEQKKRKPRQTREQSEAVEKSKSSPKKRKAAERAESPLKREYRIEPVARKQKTVTTGSLAQHLNLEKYASQLKAMAEALEKAQKDAKQSSVEEAKHSAVVDSQELDDLKKTITTLEKTSRAKDQLLNNLQNKVKNLRDQLGQAKNGGNVTDDIDERVAQLKEEVNEGKVMWKNLKDENEKLRTIHGKDVGGGRYSKLANLSAGARRFWYQGEVYLFELRIGVQDAPKSLDNSTLAIPDSEKPFMTTADIPWPISPVTSPNAPVTANMVLNFLLADYNPRQCLDMCKRLKIAFDPSNTDRWLRWVVEKDRERVRKRTEQLSQVLSDLIAEKQVEAEELDLPNNA